MNIRREYKYIHRHGPVANIMDEVNHWAARGWMIVKFDPTVPCVLMERELEDDV